MAAKKDLRSARNARKGEYKRKRNPEEIAKAGRRSRKPGNKNPQIVKRTPLMVETATRIVDKRRSEGLNAKIAYDHGHLVVHDGNVTVSTEERALALLSS